MVKKILVIRFRQIGDAILSTALCSSLKRSFPTAEVHLVLNAGIAPLFQSHPHIDKVITFDGEENKNIFKYVAKVWRVVHNEKYDVIIDMRSTVRTLLFSFFSLFSAKWPLRVGRKKWYSTLFLNRSVVPACGSMVDMNQSYADVLSSLAPIAQVKDFRLYVSPAELQAMREKMVQSGVDFSAPVMLAGVTTKLLHKRWNIAYMRTTLERIMSRYPRLQIIFNFAPGREEEDAKALFAELGSPAAVKMGVEARSLRELAALCANCTFYFGNEGGSRHLVQAMGVPSYAIFSPSANKNVWLPVNDVLAAGVGVESLPLSSPLYYKEFDSITPDVVCGELFPLLDEFCR